VPDAFYLPLGDERYLSTEHTGGPWDPALQHGGPPSALLARTMESQSLAWPATIARVSVDILGPVPVAELTVRSRVLRPGRSVDLVEAELVAGDRAVVRAQAWRVRAAELDLPALDDEYDDKPGVVPDFPAAETALPDGWRGGYMRAIEWRFVGGVWAGAGPATVWGRMRYPLVPDEEPTGLQRVLALADSGSGVSAVLPFDRWLFINPELTVHVAAPPAGQWICLDAQTTVDRSGFGLATSKLYDRDRLVARGAQSLLVGPR
jgi:Thioesterase-like superfamily